MSLANVTIDRQINALEALRKIPYSGEYASILREIVGVARDNYQRRVMIAGVGKNANIASKISETMASLGIPSFYLNVSHCGHGDFGFIGHEDIIIHISRSGTTREMVTAMEHIKLIRPNVFQALIHAKPGKPVNPAADVELCIGAVVEGDEFGLAPTTSTTALLCILDCLSVEASAIIGFKRLDFLKFHPDGALGDMLKKENSLPKTTLGDAVEIHAVDASNATLAVPVEGIPIENPAVVALLDPASVAAAKALLGEKA